MVDQRVTVTFREFNTRFFTDKQRDITPLHQFEDQLDATLKRANAGKFEGHELSPDASYGILHFVGPDAKKMFSLMEQMLRQSKITQDAMVDLRFGIAGIDGANRQTIHLAKK